MTSELKERIMNMVSELFSDTNADESEQIEALEEISSLCEDNIEVLKEQIRNQSK